VVGVIPERKGIDLGIRLAMSLRPCAGLVTGFLAERGDARSVAEQMTRILSLPDWGRGMGEAALARIRTEFSLERMVGRFEDLYGRLTEESRADHRRAWA
jgi:glycosyltransferase involved in cell wall biosynthesis